jgi:lipopolysaccharide/colanic/teichoic acid biosynthesis glycosyltransferase
MFEVRPGLTGWAQVHGRRGVEWNRRIALNVWYVDHVSLRLDIRILGMTVATLFDREDNRNTGPTVDGSRDRERATEKETATETERK